MAENITIQRNQFEDPTMDFFALRRRAIEFAQRLAGNEWTDYNEHDPGVTIIEQLCYAITDLSYRTSFDIRDILAGQPDFTGEGKDTLFTIDKVLPCQPLTLTDWRKVLLDRVENLRNVWIEIAPAEAGKPKGLYRILVDIMDGDYTDSEIQLILEDVRMVFYAHRSLCEDVDTIERLNTESIAFHASLEVDEYYDSEETLGQVLLHMDEFLSRQVPRYSLTQMLSKEFTVEQIFTGPRLNQGFILDEDLRPRPSKLLYSQMIRVILETPGVKSVYNFRIENADEEKQVYELKTGAIPVIDKRMLRRCSEYITLSKNRVKVVTEDSHVENFYDGSKMSRPKPLKEALEDSQRKFFAVPTGRDRKLNTYRSIQFNFPAIYGIGEYGMPMSAPERRKGLAKQLKAFLLLLEQLLINYAEQLNSVAKLFSTSPAVTETYFHADPATKKFPNISDLLKDEMPRDSYTNILSSEIKQLLEQQDEELDGYPFMAYGEGLKKIMENADPFFKRRDMFLDHMLARFNVELPTPAFVDGNWYLLSEKALDKSILRIKNDYLSHVPRLSELRGDACDLHQHESVSRFEAVVLLLLGLASGDVLCTAKTRWLSAPLRKYNIWLHRRDLETSVTQEYVRLVGGQIENDVVEKYFERYDTPDAEIPFSETAYPRFYEYYSEGRIYVDIDMLRNGYIVSNFAFGNESDNGDLITVVYSDPEDKAREGWTKWKRVAVCKSKDHALRVIEGTAAFIRYLNVETEGLHLVEHLLLRLPKETPRSWIEFIDRAGKTVVVSTQSFANAAEEEQIRKDIIENGNDHLHYIIHPDKKRHRWRFEIVNRQHHAIAHSVGEFMDAAAVQRAVRETHLYFQQLFKEGHDATKHCRVVTTHPQGELPPDEFYPFRMSVVMPAWSSRFGNPAFRSFFWQVLREAAPAHIVLNALWLSPTEMEQFEILYLQWRTQRAKGNHIAEKEAADLSRFLYRQYIAQQDE